MNNQIKKNKKERLEKLRKLKNLLLYVSLALNVIFVIFTIVGLCLPKESNDNTTKRRQYLSTTTNPTNLVGYDFLKYNDSTLHYSVNVNSTTIFRDNFYLIGSNNNILNENEIKIQLSLHYPRTDFDYVRVSTTSVDAYGNPLYSTSWVYQTLNGVHGWHHNTDTNLLKGLFLNKDTAYLAGVPLYPFLYLFDEIDTYTFDLNYGWSPYAYYPNGAMGFIYGDHDGEVDTLLENVVFSINGLIFDKMEIYWVRSATESTSVLMYNGEVRQVSNYISFVIQVRVSNSVTNFATNIYTMPTPTNWSYNGTTYNGVYQPFSNAMGDKNLLRVTLFDYNLDRQITDFPLYTYRTAFYVDNDAYISLYGGDSNFGLGNVFSLFSTAFSGIIGLLSINLLPNITLGMILLLPLVAMVIFAIIKIIKK